MNKTKNLDDIIKEVNQTSPISKSQVTLQGLFIDIALAIAEMRLSRHFSQRDMANKMNTAQSTIARWETPGYSSYTLSKLHEIANCLDYDLRLSFHRKDIANTQEIHYGWTQVDTNHSQPRPFRQVARWNPTIISMQEVTS